MICDVDPKTIQLAGQEFVTRTNFPSQFLPQGFAPLESFEKLFENADDDRVDADTFLLSPLPKGSPSLYSNV